MAPGTATSAHKVVAQNRKARHNYFIESSLEAGLALTGTEVKSLREGKASIAEAYAGDEAGELYLINANIPRYEPANQFNHDPKRPRKLLLHRRELERLRGQIQRQGYTLVPLRLYFNERGIAKLEIGLARGKSQVDKRQSLKEQSWKREKARLMRERG